MFAVAVVMENSSSLLQEAWRARGSDSRPESGLATAAESSRLGLKETPF